jgi:hypothetical protein
MKLFNLVIIVLLILLAGGILTGIFMFKDKDICSNLKSQTERDICYWDAFNSEMKEGHHYYKISYCDKLSEGYIYKSSCYASFAGQEEDLTICDNLVGDENILSCRDDALFALGSKNKNPQLCAKIIDSATKDRCYLFAGSNIE